MPKSKKASNKKNSKSPKAKLSDLKAKKNPKAAGAACTMGRRAITS